jgi:[ribosomal protein S18]-alanine N-acetyltransferase
MTIRAATTDDLDAIMSLETATFDGDAWSVESMRAELGSEHGHYLVVDDAERGVIAYAGLLAPRGSGQADIQTIAVSPTERRAGLGRSLMAALIAEARERGARELFLEVRADNPGAESLYRSLGFERLGVRLGYYQPDNVDAIVMKAEL